MLSSKQLFTSQVGAYFSARTHGLTNRQQINTYENALSTQWTCISLAIFNTIFLHGSSTVIRTYSFSYLTCFIQLWRGWKALTGFIIQLTKVPDGYGHQLVFSGWGKPEYPEKNPLSTGENQPNLYLHELISKWMLLSWSTEYLDIQQQTNQTQW